MTLKGDSSSNCEKRPKILVVRAKRVEDEFLELLNDANLDFQSIPIMSIKRLPASKLVQDVIENFEHYHFAIFISSNAVKFGVSSLQHSWPTLPQGVQYLCVGQNTGQLLSKYASNVASPNTMLTTEGLLLMPQLKLLTDKKVAIFRGKGGREDLTIELKERGALVSVCELYQRFIDKTKVALARSQLPSVDCLVAHSGQLLESMGKPPETSVDRICVIVPSARVGGIARGLGYKRVVVAESALPTAMLKSTKKALQKKS